MKDKDNKMILITGASRGIGEAIAKKLLSNGSSCVLVARNKQKLEQICLQYPQHSLFFAIDLTSKENVEKLINFLEIKGIIPNVIIHNVGGNMEGDTHPLCYEVFEKCVFFNFGISLDINYKFLPLMKEQGDGHIIYISSDSAIDGYSPPAYVASKAAINAYVKSSARFYAQYGICFNSIMPGIIEFPNSPWDKIRQTEKERYDARKNNLPLKRFGQVTEVADFVCNLCKNKNMLTTGGCYVLNGGGYKRGGDVF